LSLSVKILLFLFLLFDVLALDDLLSLLRHTVKLNVECTLLEILDLEAQLLVLKRYLLELGAVFQDVCHVSDL
jgi:hypothetical protein